MKKERVEIVFDENYPDYPNDELISKIKNEVEEQLGDIFHATDDDIASLEEYEWSLEKKVNTAGPYYCAYCAHHNWNFRTRGPTIFQYAISEHRKKPGTHAIRTWTEPS
ncbi:Uncharacterised protein [Vibrio paracholerae]|uniref:hypothetical protein n=1 Tax=Vibrio paracholerae TaxID=650003 RepID=UPI000E5BCE6B|nr:hypothetical protein [Vibrio paracholerae]SYZ83183.1 Uncharacterised protein [Vibrio paracholerae]